MFAALAGMTRFAASPAVFALVFSVAANAVLGWMFLAARGDVATCTERLAVERRQAEAAQADAQACSEGVAEWRRLADARQRQADAARQRAASVARTHERRADAQLAAPPAVAGDDCASAQVRVRDWLEGRR